MIGLAAFTVFALGLRHGADPDHLAAIDNVTRNAYAKTPLLSRFVGTLFAGGHSVMILAMSALVGLLGAHFAHDRGTIERFGAWLSVVVLLSIAAMNLRQLRISDAGAIAGVKTRLLPRALRDSASAFAAVPIGMLFGVGFETTSQVATYAVAFGTGAGVAGALIVGVVFCLGMIVTDTLDSVLVHRLVSFPRGKDPHLTRVWIVSVTALAIVVAAYELAQLLGWKSPLSDLGVSAILVAALVAVFGYVFAKTRGGRLLSGGAAQPDA
jgi:nickel/cobalt transporter (NiCoT) family protein